MEKSTKIMVLEITAGIIFHNLVCVVLAFFFFRRGPVFSGLLVGMVGAVLMLLHMAYCLERAARSPDSGEAGRKTAGGVLIRGICYMAVLTVALWKFSDRINVLAVAVGALGLKTGAYLQPAVRRLRGGKADGNAGSSTDG